MPRPSQLQKQRSKTGKAGENVAAITLRAIGVLMVQEIGTPFVITNTRPGGWLQGYFKERVSGDIIGHTRNGTSVLAEIKTITSGNLTWSSLREHQPERLDQHAEHAISLLVWVTGFDVFVMDWRALHWVTPEQPEPLLAPGKSITQALAAQMNIRDIEDLE